MIIIKYSVTAIIVAGGKGTRMKSDVPKQFLMLKEKPIIYYTIDIFNKCNGIDNIVLVLPKDSIDYCKYEIVEKYGFNKVRAIVEGGEERNNSVLNGLRACSQTDYVLIHDGLRPFVTEDIIRNGIKYSIEFGGAACGVISKDTIKIKGEDGFSTGTPDRNSMFLIQTPQCFKYDEIKFCHENILEENINITDDTMVFEYFNNKVYLYEGSYSNIKITTREDLKIAEVLMEDKFNIE